VAGGEAPGNKLAEVERIRQTLERSSRAADERLRATEAVIAAVVREAVEERAVVPVSEGPTTSVADGTQSAQTRRGPAVARRPAAQRKTVPADPGRGQWSPPAAGT
jgi:hypothetical protein